MKRAIMINPQDNTAIAFNDIEAGDDVSVISASGEVIRKISAAQVIPFGHKIALAAIGKGENVLKYGEIIGVATQPINKGGHVHVHNVASALLPGPA
jgi:altronate dehydratase